ncbi:response regulator [Kordiimonas gwangyangensis]|uniref:response regulator n=1 Tax=Kordiimonas gwangyangensis TaxID=288022 RepID=UPI0003644ACD|nr:response regulator [Kordiimonas gwangyangensis]
MSVILHVDDDEVMRKLVAGYLTDLGHEVVSAENGLEGMKMAEQMSPDLILMDIDMPVLDGYAATQQLRGKGYKGLIAALTGSERVRDLANAVVAGCDDFIPKPLTNEFPELVTAILEKEDETDNAMEDDFFDD